MMKKKILGIGMTVVLTLTCLSGCSGDELPQGGYENEILTTTAVEQDKTMVTVRVEFGAGQESNLEEVLEEKFPNVDIVLRHDGSTSSVYTAQANLEADVECDLILSRRLPIVLDVAEQYLLDLSAEDFVNNYYMSAVDSCTDDKGKVYFLPGPSDVYGIVYDKTMFEENDWEVPSSYSEFIKLINTIKASGVEAETKTDAGESINVPVVPLQASLMYPDMFQILFNTYGYEQAYAGTDNYKWLSSYQSGEGSMVGHMESAVASFKKLFDDGMLSVSDMDVSPSERSNMMYSEHSTAMIIECQNAVSYAKEVQENENDTNPHEIAMMPFWTSDKEDSDYLYLIPAYYMAINKKSAEESDEKKELLLEIYRYLSSVDGQEILIGDNFEISNVMGVPVEKNSFSEGIIDTIEKGQTVNTFYLAEGETDKQVERQLLGTAKDMLTGKMTVRDWLLAADKTRDDFLAGNLNKEESYGTVEETMTRLESAFTVADMYRTLADTQIGICYGGGWDKSTNGYFYKGAITDSSLSCITPNKEPAAELEYSMDEKIVVASLTGSQILDILNSTMGKSDTEGLYPYYVAAGLTVRFNPWGKEGERVLSCSLDSGEELESDKVYTVAYFADSLPEDSRIVPESALDMTWQEAFLKWLDSKGGKLQKPQMTITLEYDE